MVLFVCSHSDIQEFRIRMRKRQRKRVRNKSVSVRDSARISCALQLRKGHQKKCTKNGFCTILVPTPTPTAYIQFS